MPWKASVGAALVGYRSWALIAAGLVAAQLAFWVINKVSAWQLSIQSQQQNTWLVATVESNAILAIEQ